MAGWPFASALPAHWASWEIFSEIKLKNFQKPAIAQAIAGFVF
jgi:hypothetical protein